MNWGSDHVIDCVSVIARPGPRWDRPNVVVRNTDFMAEANSANAELRVYRGTMSR